MLEFFKSSQRRQGVLLLAVALTLGWVWWRSVLVKDALEIAGGYRIYSAVGQIGIGPGPTEVPKRVEWKQEKIPSTLQTWFAWPFVSRRSMNVPYWCFAIPIAGTGLLLLLNRTPSPTLMGDEVRESPSPRKRWKKKK